MLKDEVCAYYSFEQPAYSTCKDYVKTECHEEVPSPKKSTTIIVSLAFIRAGEQKIPNKLHYTFHCDGASSTLGLRDRTYSRAAAGVMCLYSTYKT